MDHDNARRLMAEAVEGQLSPDDERELALHLVGCTECKGVYEGLQHANPALTSIELGILSPEALDEAVFRATTVLRGDADPGPVGLSEEAPRLPEIPDANTVRIDTSYDHEEDFRPAGPFVPTGPIHPPAPSIPARIQWEVPETHVRPIEPEIVESPPDIPIELEEPDVPDAPEVHERPGPLVADPVDTPLPPLVPIEQPTEQVPVEHPVEKRSEIETLLDEDRSRYEALPVEEDDRVDIGGPGPWLLAIAVAVVLAVIAGVLVFRGQGLFGGGGGDLPTAAETRRSVERAFTDMKSLKVTFDVTKLSLYRVGRDASSLTYSFSNGKFGGHIAYDRSLGYKEDFTLDVRGDEVERAEIVQTSDETRSLVGAGADQRLLVEKNPPLGPPDGNLRPSLGLLEDALGSAAVMLADAEDLKVVGRTQRDGRELYTVTADVPPTPLSRADRIEAALDATTFFPVIVKRSIGRANAHVLGPSEALSDEAIDRAFATNERVTTEIVQLDNLMYDDIVLQNDLVLDVPEGVDEQQSDSKYERLTRAELSGLDFKPLVPRTLPTGFEDQLFAVYKGSLQAWGPGKTLPKPQSVFHAEYFDGKTTIVVTERKMKEKFALDESPLKRAGLPITTRRVVVNDKEFFYGTSPELPPHAYGFLGNTFVMAVGYAPQAQLIRMLSSLAETPSAVPGEIDLSPSPLGSPGATPSPFFTATPGASTTP